MTPEPEFGWARPPRAVMQARDGRDALLPERRRGRQSWYAGPWRLGRRGRSAARSSDLRSRVSSRQAAPECWPPGFGNHWWGDEPHPEVCVNMRNLSTGYEEDQFELGELIVDQQAESPDERPVGCSPTKRSRTRSRTSATASGACSSCAAAPDSEHARSSTSAVARSKPPPASASA